MLSPCPHEKDVKALVAKGQWPHGCSSELKAHADGCSACAQLVLMTETFRSARGEAMAHAKLPLPGLLWWRAQLRKRDAAVERVGRTLLSAHLFALAVNLVVIAAFVVWQARQGFTWRTWFSSPDLHAQSLRLVAFISSLRPPDLLSSGLNSISSPLVLISFVSSVALLGGVAVYLATEKE